MGQIVGTPDWQRGVASAQKLLGHFTSVDTAKTVGVPPNAETVVILTQLSTLAGNLVVTGHTSGQIYIWQVDFNVIAGVTWVQFYIDVSSSVDSQIDILFNTAPTADWWVYSDQAAHISFDPIMQRIVSESNTPPGLFGVMSMGFDTVDAQFLAVDSGGRQIPMMCYESSGQVEVLTASTPVLAAPAQGHLYLYGVDYMFSGASTGNDVINVFSSGVNTVCNIGCRYAYDAGHFSLEGYQANGDITAIASRNAYLTIRYAVGP